MLRLAVLLLAVACCVQSAHAVCGNNIVEVGEQCDNTAAGGCCLNTCLSALNNTVTNPSAVTGTFTLPYALTTTLASFGLTSAGANYPVAWSILSATPNSATYNPGVTFSISGNTNLNWNRVYVGTFNVTFQTIYCNSPLRALYFTRQLAMPQFESCTCITDNVHPWCANSPLLVDETRCDCFTRQCYRRDSTTSALCGSRKCRAGYNACSQACNDLLVTKPKSFTILGNDCVSSPTQCSQTGNLACTCNPVCGDSILDSGEGCDAGSPAPYGSCCTHNCSLTGVNPSPTTGTYTMPTCTNSTTMTTLNLFTGGANYVVIYELVSVTNVSGLGATLISGTTLQFNRTFGGVAVVTFRALFCTATSQYFTFTRTITGVGCCKNGIVEYGEFCDAGPTSGLVGSCCTTDCQEPRTGNGLTYYPLCRGNNRIFAMNQIGLDTANFPVNALTIIRNKTWYEGVGEFTRDFYTDRSVPAMVSNSTTTTMQFTGPIIGGINITWSYNYCSAPATTLTFWKTIWIPRCYCDYCTTFDTGSVITLSLGPECYQLADVFDTPSQFSANYRCDCSKVTCFQIQGSSDPCGTGSCSTIGYNNCSYACRDVVSPKPVSLSLQRRQTSFASGTTCPGQCGGTGAGNPTSQWINCTCAPVCGDGILDVGEFCDSGSNNGLEVGSCCTTNCQAPVVSSAPTFSYTLPSCSDRVSLAAINILQTGGNFLQAWSVANYTGVTGLTPVITSGNLVFGDFYTGTVVFTLRARWCSAPNQYIFVTRTITNDCCDNSVIDPGEDCDLGGSGNGGSSTCCSNNCQFRPTSRQCRGAASVCDAPEFCTGVSDTCPPNVVYNNTVVCRPAISVCDVEEKCNGVVGTCPTDTFANSSTLCRAATDFCDAPEFCTGASSTCPANAFKSASVVCRNASGACDLQETCTGSSATCPANAFASASVVCRPATGGCDQPETCTGASPACPSDLFFTNTRLCRNTSGDCDVPEYCTGVDVACPADFFVTAGTTCRPAAGDCDQPETCTGSSGACPVDAYRPSDYTCRTSAGICDVIENCTGASVTCPADALVNAGIECRAAAGDCDTPETCTGGSALCPSDTLRPNGHVCRNSTGPCDQFEVCTGVDVTCPTDGYLPQGVVCRNSTGDCDPQDVCSGDSALCVDVVYNSTVVCRPSAGSCDVAENCDGVGGACPVDTYLPSTQECRVIAGPCDIAENCTGSSPLCPADAVRPADYVCAAATSNCTTDALCTGLSVTCPDNNVPGGTRCYNTSNLCFVSECNGNGACLTVLAIDYNDGLYCNGVETCDPLTGLIVPGTPVSCDDGNSCTVDACSNILSACVNTPQIGTTGPCGGGLGACTPGNYSCDGSGPTPVITCVGEVLPTTELCGDGIDNNCNGIVDGICIGQGCVTDADCANITLGPCDQVSCSPNLICNITRKATDSLCNDNIACTYDDKCTALGMCAGSPVVCDDYNDCTVDYCTEPYGRCVFDANLLVNTLCPGGRCSSRGVCTPPHQTCPIVDETSCVRYVFNRFTGLCDEIPRPGACLDKDGCTLFDTCINGTCVGTPKDCDDHIECTIDRCNSPGGTCESDIAPGNCYIDGRCWLDGAINPTCACGVCNSTLSTIEWSLPLTPLPCDDGDTCTESDACNVLTGVCEGAPIVCPSAGQCEVAECLDGACRTRPTDYAAPCDDGDPCTMHDACELGRCRGVPASCVNSSAPCLVGTCDPLVGCTAQPVENYTRCNPTEDLCAGVFYCLDGVCVDAGPVVCPTSTNPCLEFVCEPQRGCVERARVGQSCDDGNACTQGDACSATGTCLPGGLWTNCDDLNDCTDDLCLAGFGCTHIPIANCQQCNVTADCSQQTCQQVNCVRGQCRYIAEPAGFSCADSDVCNGQEVCTGNGVCVSLGPFNCDDGNPCTDDGCDAQLGCTHAANSLNSCNDTDPCTVGDHCSAEGFCVGDPYPCLNDTTCLDYSCVAVGGAPTCTATPINVGSSCTTGDPCKNNGVCGTNGVCVEVPLVCPPPSDCVESYICQNGTCLSVLAPNGTVCNTRNLCKDSVCLGGTCVAVADAVTCTPTSDCEVDAVCVPATGECAPVYAQDGAVCDDTNLCTQSSHCVAGQCVGAEPVICIAPDACHRPGVCDPDTGICAYAPLANNTPCPGTNPNATSSTCLSGVCVDNDPVYCAPSENECLVARFVEGLGCVYNFVDDGTPCDDDDICNYGETCQSGECVGGQPYNCSYDTQCAPSYCLAYSGCVSLGIDDCRPCSDDASCPYIPCKAAACVAGTCAYRDDDTATSGCFDDQYCNGREFCFAGTCHVKPAPDCYNDNDCTLNVCDYALQQCRHVPLGNVTCDSDDLCAVSAQCDGQGHCLTTHSLQCEASTPCRESLGCNPKTGACEYVFAEDGTECAFADNKCAARATCYNGVCHVVENVTCAGDCACNAAGACDPLTGSCVEPTTCNRELCSDGDKCTLGDRCDGSTCVPGPFSPCDYPAIDTQCRVPRCVSEDGSCSYENLPDGLPCDTGVSRGPCSGADVCDSGTCVRRYETGMLCREATPGGCDTPEYCSGDSDNCPVNGFAKDDTPCPNSLFCYSNTCHGGRCLPALLRDCSEYDGPCTIGVCDETASACLPRSRPEHTPCISGAEGQCVPFSSCETGVCTPQYANELTPCTDGTLCSVDDHCSGYNGACVAGSVVSCAHLDGPCTLGTCNPLTGVCVATTINEGVLCDADANPCTSSDTCVSGVCTSGVAVDCSYLNSSCQYGACVPVSATETTCVPVYTDRACDPDYCAGGCTVPFQWWALHTSRCRNPAQQFTWPADLEEDVACGQTYYYWSQKRARTVWIALFQEWLAATLNNANGACLPPTIADVLLPAQTLLTQCDTELVGSAPGARLYKSYAILLKTYNSGMFGPGECTQAPCAASLYDSDYFACLFQTRDVVPRAEAIDFFSADSCENGMWDYVSESCQCFVGWAGLDCTECDPGLNPDETFICVPSMVSRDFALRSVPNDEVPLYFDEDVLLEIVRMTGRRSRYPGDGKLDCACQRLEERGVEERDLAVYIAQDDTIIYIDTIEQSLQLCEQVFDVTVINANPACNNESIVVVVPGNQSTCAPTDWHYICDCCGPEDDECVCPRNDVMCLRNHVLEEHRRLRLYQLLFVIFSSIAGLLLLITLVQVFRRRRSAEKQRLSARDSNKPAPVAWRLGRRRKNME